jgi:hypothetical protein
MISCLPTVRSEFYGLPERCSRDLEDSPFACIRRESVVCFGYPAEGRNTH